MDKLKSKLQYKYWRYKYTDKSTWKYLACSIRDGKITWMRNPEFKYLHLDNHSALKENEYFPSYDRYKKILVILDKDE